MLGKIILWNIMYQNQSSIVIAINVKTVVATVITAPQKEQKKPSS
jgi:hypothetical protein